MEVDSLWQKIKNKENDLIRKRAIFDKINEDIAALKIELNKSKALDNELLQISEVLAKTAAIQKKEKISQIEYLVTTGLQYVYGVGYWVEMVDENNDGSELELYLCSKIGEEIFKEIPESGGFLNVISLLLRLAWILISNEDTGDTILFDEPCKEVDTEALRKVGEFIKIMMENEKKQIIMVTHSLILAEVADMKYLVTQDFDTRTAIVERIE